MTIATYKVVVDWAATGDFTGANDDITSDVLGGETARGRDFASQLTGRSRAGTLVLELDNTSDKYNSFNSGSALYGNLLPGRKVQVQTDNGFPYTFPLVFAGEPIWTGFIESIDPQMDMQHRKTATLRAHGSLGQVFNKKVRVAMQTSYRSDQAVGDVLDDAEWPAADRALETGQTTFDRWWTDEKRAAAALREIEASEGIGAMIWEKANGDIAFADRKYRLSNADSITSKATYTDAGGGALVYSQVQQQDPYKQIYNIVEAEVQIYTVGSLATLWTLGESGASSPVIEPISTRDFWATYPNPDSGTDAVAVDAWTAPVENTDYEANTAADGSGTDKSGMLNVTATKFSNAMKISIENTDTVPVYLTLLQARGTPVTVERAKIVAEDSSSQNTYDVRTYPIAAPFIPDTNEAENYTRAVVSIYKDPIPVLRMGLVANRDQTHMAEALVRDIHHRVTVVATGNAGLGINEDFYIEAIRHSIRRDRYHIVWFDLSPVAEYWGAWTLGVSELGVNTRLVY